MYEVELLARFVVTLLGVAFPVILQIISRLDDKYKSVSIVALFDREFIKKAFIILLAISLISIFIWSFKFKPFNEFSNCCLVNNSAAIFVVITIILLIVCFFRLVAKIFIYSIPIKLANYLKEKISKQLKNNLHNNNNEDYVKALSDVLNFSIREGNYELLREIKTIINNVFIDYQTENGQYPNSFYFLVYNAVEELTLKQRNPKLLSLVDEAMAGWLLGVKIDKNISEQTFIWIWNCINLVLESDKDYMIERYWEYAHRFFDFKIGESELEKRFLEFQFALGGILIFNGKVNLIEHMFSYTNIEPPNYYLLPKDKPAIFSSYNEIMNLNDDSFTTRYPYSSSIVSTLQFPKINKSFITKYFSLLYLRQTALDTNQSYIFSDELKANLSRKRGYFFTQEEINNMFITNDNNTFIIDTLTEFEWRIRWKLYL